MVRMSNEARVQLEAFKEVRVKHPRLEEVDAVISQAIEEHAGHSHLLVYGALRHEKSFSWGRCWRLLSCFVSLPHIRCPFP